MLNETASSTEDRPALRPSVRQSLFEHDRQQEQVRTLVADVFAIEAEDYSGSLEPLRRDGAVGMNPDARLVASFEGHLLHDSETAYAQLDSGLEALNCLPLFRESEGKQFIHVLAGRFRPQPRRVWVNIVLFVATVFSVLLVGTEVAIGEIAYAHDFDPQVIESLTANLFGQLWRGIPYALSIILILGAHEMGHYFAARRHRVAVTLPYFIPAPFISFLGTFGAAIQLREPMRNRKVLFDIGAAGPLAGLVFAIPILFIGLATSPVGPITPGGLLEGNSIVYATAKIITFGRFLPDGQVDVYINQLARAGWAGLLVTALNLIPVGQLDGGHILYSLIGGRARRLYWPMVVGAVALAFLNEAWIFWIALLLFLGRVYAVPLDNITRLDNRRRWLAVASLIIFILIFVPVPLTQIPPATPDTIAPRNSVGLFGALNGVTAGLSLAAMLLWTRRPR